MHACLYNERDTEYKYVSVQKVLIYILLILYIWNSERYKRIY